MQDLMGNGTGVPYLLFRIAGDASPEGGLVAFGMLSP